MFLTVLETRKSEMKGLADLIPAENSLPGLQTAAFLLDFHTAEKV